jgi:hypothetical protein
MDTTTPATASLSRALAAVADTAIDQVRDLAVAKLDGWAACLHDRLADTSGPHPSPTPASVITPVIIGALAGVAAAWLLAHRGEDA